MQPVFTGPTPSPEIQWTMTGSLVEPEQSGIPPTWGTRLTLAHKHSCYLETQEPRTIQSLGVDFRTL